MKITSVLITREDAWPADAPVNFNFEESLVEVRCPNIFRRFELAAAAQHETVYVQDDDVVIDVKRLYSLYLTAGLKPTNVMPLGFQQIYGGTGVTMIGFGCFFQRSLAERFVAHQQFWRAEFGDEIFETEADRFFTYSHQPFHNVTIAMRQISRAVKMSKRPNHYAIRTEIFERLKHLGSL